MEAKLPPILATALNEWMRRYVEEPERFNHEWQAVLKFKEEDVDGNVPTYGSDSVAYLESIIREIGI